jgi:hypothetical protein
MNKKLKARIIELYGTQFDFSQAIKCHECDVSRVIRGRKKLSTQEQRVWEKALKCKPETIFIKQ